MRPSEPQPVRDESPSRAPTELQQRYGGVGGPLYRRYADEIERRIAALEVHQR